MQDSILQLKSVAKAEGIIVLPGSKSMTNRALLLSALSSEPIKLQGLLISEDTQYMFKALQALGVDICLDHQTCSGVVTGGLSSNREQLTSPLRLDLGNAGTAMRPLTAVLATSPGCFELHGNARMHERPIADLVEPLRAMGADIEYLGLEGYPPLRIQGQRLMGGHIKMAANLSSQYVSAMLMAAPLMAGETTIELTGKLVSAPYIQMTLTMMRRFGIHVQATPRGYHIPQQAGYRAPQQYQMEGDASTASYFLAAAAVAGEVTVQGVGRDSLQGDLAFLGVLQQMGAGISIDTNQLTCRSQGGLQGIDVSATDFPDAAMTLAVLALFAQGSTTIRDIYNWRIKETDRLTAMATELVKVGATVKAGCDYITITPPRAIAPALIETYDDHRMAMAFSLLCFSSRGVRLANPECVVKTCPDYFMMLRSITEQHG
jgi:3-phosphoshikimate 1-carboxyvinyltransferase